MRILPLSNGAIRLNFSCRARFFIAAILEPAYVVDL